jgi:hypothetical protein
MIDMNQKFNDLLVEMTNECGQTQNPHKRMHNTVS